MHIESGDCVIIKNAKGATHLEVVDRVNVDGTVVTIASRKYAKDNGHIVGVCSRCGGLDRINYV